MLELNLPIDLFIDCVVVSSSGSDFSFPRHTYRKAGLRIHHAASLDEADFLLMVTGSTVLLADVAFATRPWKSALSLLCNRHPLVTLLVIGDPMDILFTEDLFIFGAYGVLWKPLQFNQVKRLIRTVHTASKECRFLNEKHSCQADRRASFS